MLLSLILHRHCPSKVCTGTAQSPRHLSGVFGVFIFFGQRGVPFFLSIELFVAFGQRLWEKIRLDGGRNTLLSGSSNLVVSDAFAVGADGKQAAKGFDVFQAFFSSFSVAFRISISRLSFLFHMAIISMIIPVTSRTSKTAFIMS